MSPCIMGNGEDKVSVSAFDHLGHGEGGGEAELLSAPGVSVPRELVYREYTKCTPMHLGHGEGGGEAELLRDRVVQRAELAVPDRSRYR
eukprot:scaffold26947_cov30-Phaeocystis_antarctica.AAC.2